MLFSYSYIRFGEMSIQILHPFLMRGMSFYCWVVRDLYIFQIHLFLLNKLFLCGFQDVAFWFPSSSLFTLNLFAVFSSLSWSFLKTTITHYWSELTQRNGLNKLFVFSEKGEGREKGRETWISCLSHTLSWWPGPRPRHVPWSGIKPMTFQFTSWRSAHCATPARA